VDECKPLVLAGAKAAAGHDWFFGARPGRRLWLCRVASLSHGAATNAAEGVVPEAGWRLEVVATLRPSVPEASPPPGRAPSTLLNPKPSTLNPKP
jgi:hypothetical protein